MAKGIKCSLIPASSSLVLGLYIRKNRNLTDSEVMYKGVVDAINNVEGAGLKDAFLNNHEGFETYIRDIATLIKGLGNVSEIKFFSDFDKDILSEGLLNQLQKTFINETIVPVDLEEEIKEPEENFSGPEIEEMTNGEENPSSPSIMSELDEIAKRRAKIKGELEYGELIDLYFEDKEDLAENFSNYFKKSFYNSWINTDLDSKGAFKRGHTKDLNKVVNELKNKTSNDIWGQHALANLSQDELLESDLVEVYYDYIIGKELTSLIKEFQPGIDVTDEGTIKATKGEFYGRTGFATNEDLLGGMAQTTDALNNHLENTPRLKENQDGTFTIDPDLPFLTRNDIINVAPILLELDNDQDFEENFLKLIQKEPRIEIRSVLQSIYNKFFNPEPYTVDGVLKGSFSKIKSLKDVVNDARRFMLSISNRVLLGNKNGKIVDSSDYNLSLKYVLENTYNISISDSKSPSKIKNSIAKNISIEEGLDGAIDLKIKVSASKIHTITLKPTSNYKSGVIVQVKNTTVSTAREKMSVLSALGLPASMVNKKFLDYYNDNIGNFSATNNINLDNFIGNIAFMVAFNDKAFRNKLKELDFHAINTEEATTDKNKLDFPPFEYLYSFMQPLLAYDEKLSNISLSKQVLNVNGDYISVANIASTMDRTKNRLKEERSYGENSVHNNNLLVQENSGYSIEGFVFKDGITVGNNKKGNQNFTKREHFKSAVIDNFLMFGSRNNFGKAAFQSATMSDRKNPPIIVFNGNFGDTNELKIITKGKGKGMTKGMFKIYQYEQQYHNNLAEKITNGWLKQFKEWGEKGDLPKVLTDSAAEFIVDIYSLELFLENNPIPTSLVKKSKILFSRFMYNPKSKDAKLNSLFLEMVSIWNDEAKALDFMKKEYNNFIAEITQELSLSNLNSLERSIMTQHFQGTQNPDLKATFYRMLKSYWQESTLMSRNALNIVGGHIYQYKGDIEINEGSEAKKREVLLDKGHKEEEINEILKLDRIQNALSKAVIDQSKRLAMVTSGQQKPKLINDSTAGKELGTTTKAVLVEDEKDLVQLLGDLSSSMGQESYDAAMLVHPLYTKRLNESLGNENSGFSSKGGAIKDISLYYDPETGSLIGQKKASFNVFTNEMLKKSPALQRLFKKMNTAIEFKEPLNGANNMYELWLSYGGFDNEYAWDQILSLLSTAQDSEGKYSYRDSYVEKIGFESGEKMGNRGFNSYNIWKDTTTPLIYTELDNKYHGIILNADHSVDTSGDEGGKSMMTQLLSAGNFEGYSLEEMKQIYSSLEALSNLGIDNLETNIKDIAREQLRSKLLSNKLGSLKEGEYNRLKYLVDKNIHTEEEEREYKKHLTNHGILNDELQGTATEEYIRELTAKAINSRDSFHLNELVKPEVNGLNTMQLSSVVHSAIQSVINKETNQLKFKGQELVVSPSKGFIKLYTIPGTNKRVSRDEYIKAVNLAYTRISTLEDLDRIAESDFVIFNEKPERAANVKLRIKTEEDLKNNTLKAYIIDEEQAEDLKWMNYIHKETKESINKSEEYIALLAISDEIKSVQKTASDEEMELLLEKKAKAMSDLQDLLSNGKWDTLKAEIVAPSLHMQSFDLYENEEDNESPSEGAQPLQIYDEETNSFRDVSITDIMGYTQENGVFYVKDGEEVAEGTKGAISVYGSEIDSMVEFFTDRIEENENKYKLNKKFKTYDELNTEKLGNVLESYKSRLLNTNGSEAAGIENIIKVIQPIFEEYTKSGIADLNLTSEALNSINNIIEQERSNYVAELAKRKAYIFPQSLEAFIARVPGQSKQSGAPAQIKNFVFSNRNAIYAPIEMLTVTGADHDIDKVHALVYSIDENGIFYSFKDYLNEEGKIDIKIYNDLLLTKLAEFEAKLNFANITGEKAKEKLLALRKKEMIKFREGTKNFIISKLIEVYSDPKNAIEASTPMSMDELKSIIEEEWTIGETEEGETVTNSNRISPYSAASIYALERINALGKDGIGIFATGLKVYASVYQATLDNLNIENKFSSHLDAIGVDIKQYGKKDKEVEKIFKEYYDEKFEGDYNAIVIYDGDGEPIISRDISGISKWRTNVNRFKDAWRDLSQLLSAATDNAKELILARIGADSVTSSSISAAIIAGIPMKHVLDLFKTKEVKDIIKKVNDKNDIVLNPSGFYSSLDSVLKEDWSNRSTYMLNNIKVKKQALDAAKKNFKPDVPSARLIKANINADINNVSLHSNRELNTDFGITTIVEDSKDTNNYVDKAMQLGIVKKGMPEDQIISLMKSLENATSIIYKDGGLDNNEKAFVKSYSQLNKIEYIPVESVDKLMLKPGKLVVLGRYLDSTKEDRANQNIVNLINKTKLAINNEAEYDKIVEAELISKIKDIEDKEQRLKTALSSYLSDGARQLLEINKLGKEMKSLSQFLSINGGTPNGRFEVHNFIQKIANTLETNKEYVEDFFNAVIDKDEAAIQKVIDSYEPNKIGINPFFIMANTPSFMAQVRGMLYGTKLDRASVFNGNAIEKIITGFRTNLPREKSDYNEINSLVYALTIDSFLKKYDKKAKVYGNVYDLTTPEGREQFILAMPDLIVNKIQKDPALSNNIFIQRLKLDIAKEGTKTISYLQSDNLDSLEPGEKVIRKNSLNKLLKMGTKYEELHNALYLYSLIIDKGAKRSYNFASLYDVKNTKANSEYVNFLNETQKNKTLFDSIDNLSSIAKELLTPKSIKTISTAPKSEVVYGEDGEVVDGFDQSDMIQKTNGFLYDNKQTMPKKKKGKFEHQVFKSAETGQIYVLRDEKEYIPVTQAVSSRAIPFNSAFKNIKNNLEGSGFQFGYDVVVDESGTIGRVVSFNKKYRVEFDNAEVLYLETKDIQRFNPDMLFSGKNFGPLLEVDKVLMESKRGDKINTALTTNELEKIKKGPLYKALTLTSENEDKYSLGEVLGSIFVKGVEAEIIYKGKHNKSNKTIFSNLRNNSESRKLSNDSNRYAHILEYRLKKPLLEKPVKSLNSFGISRVSLNRIKDNKTNSFVTSKDLKIQEGESDLFSYEGKIYSIKNNGLVKNKYTKANKKALADILAIESKGSNISYRNLDAYFDKDSNHSLYEVTPYNIIERSTNSYVEYNLLKNKPVQANLTGEKVSLMELGKSASVAAKLKEYGLENVSYFNHIDEVYKTVEEDLQKDKEILGIKELDYALSNSEKISISAVLNPEVSNILMVTDFESKARKEAKKLNKDQKDFVKKVLNASPVSLIKNEAVTEIQKTLNNEFLEDETSIDYLTSLLVEIKSKYYSKEEAVEELKNKLDYSESKTIDNINNILDILFKESTLSKETRFRAYGESFAPMQAAKRSGKDFFVFNPRLQSWFKYDSETGDFVNSRIPKLKNNDLFIGENLINEYNINGVDSVLRATSNFKLLQNKPAGLPFKSTDLIIPGTEVNEKINNTINSGAEVLNTLEVSQEEFTEEVSINGVRIPATRDGYTSLDFIELKDSNTIIKEKQDGTISISTEIDNKEVFIAIFPEESLRKEYGDFEGYKIINDLKININGNLYIIPQAHYTSEEYFERRNLNITEKKEIKVLEKQLEEKYLNEVYPVYSALRYKDPETASKFVDVDSYPLFLFFGKNGNLDFTPEEKALFDELLIVNQGYENLLKDIEAKINKLTNPVDFNVVDVKIGNSPYTEGPNNVQILISDINLENKIISKPRGFKPEDNTFVLPIITEKDNNYDISLEGGVRKRFESILREAKNNPSKTFFLDLNGSLQDRFIGNLANEKVWKTISHAIYKINPVSWPSNFVVTGPGANYLNEEKGGFSRRSINRTIPYTIVEDITEDNIIDVTYLDNNFKFKDGRTIIDVYRVSTKSYKEVWKDWVAENRKDFEQFARRVGTKSLYDQSIALNAQNKFFGSNPNENAYNSSTAVILTEILNEEFINNDWLYYSRYEYKPEGKFEGLLENQYRLPISEEYKNKLNFSKEDKVILNIDGKDYVASIIEASYGAKGFSEKDLIFPMGLTDDINANQYIKETYNIEPTDAYFILSLTPAPGSRPKTNKVEKGTFDKLLRAAIERGDIDAGDIPSNFEGLASKATVSIGLDLKSQLSAANEADSPVYSTARLERLKNVLGSQLSLDYNSGDAIHFYGTNLTDGLKPEEIISSFNQKAKRLLDHITTLNADLIIGDDTGLDELTKEYILYSRDYVKVEDNLYRHKSQVTEPYTPKNSERIKLYGNRYRKLDFKGSNTEGKPEMEVLLREQNIKNNYSYELDINPSTLKGWKDIVDNNLIKNLFNDYNIVKSEDSLFSNELRSDLITEEQRYISRYIGAKALIETNKIEKVNTLEEFDLLVTESRKDEEFNQYYLELLDKVFDDSLRMKDISDVGSLAMARSRTITNIYLKDIFTAKVDPENNIYSDLLNNNRKEYERSRAYREMLNDPNLNASTIKLIEESKNTTNQDLYYLATTLGVNKVYKKGKLSSLLVNNFFARNNVNGFTINKEVYLTNINDLFPMGDSKPVYDLNEGQIEKPIEFFGDKLEAILTSINKPFVDQLKNKNILSIDRFTNTVYASVGDEILSYEFDEKSNKQEFQTALYDIKRKLVIDMFNDINLTLTEDDITKNIRENRKFIGLARFTGTPMSKALFFRVEEDLPKNLNSVVAGTAYNVVENDLVVNKVYPLIKEGSTVFIDRDGNLYEAKDNKLSSLNTKLNFNAEKESFILAEPGLEGEAGRLKLINGFLENGIFIVNSEENSFKAINRVDGKEYIWISEARSWKPLNDQVNLSVIQPETIIKAGDRVSAIRLNGGLEIALQNGIAISDDVIEDTRAKYTRDEKTGLWNLESPIAIRGFQNPEIRYQKKAVIYTDNENVHLASKSVSPVVISKLINKLASVLEMKINTVSNLDLELDERFAGSKSIKNSKGFVYEGEVFINIDTATLDTPIHEILGHVFLSNIKQTDKILYDSIIKKSLEEISAKEDILTEYPELENSPEDLANEIFSSIIGVKLQSIAEEEINLNFWGKISKLMREFFTEKLGPLLGLSKKLNPKSSLNDIIKELGNDVFKGKGTIFKELSPLSATNLGKIINPTLTEEQIADKFKEYGWIKEICR
jgi:hypothetical protein